MKRLMIFLVFLLLCGARLEAQGYCQLMSVTQILFGTYSGAMVTSTGSIGVTCTNGLAYNIELSVGYSGSATNREMYCSTCTPQTLGYQLFSNASYATNWGNTPTTDLNTTGTGGTQNFTVYGEIPANEAYFSGSSGTNYDDDLIVTIVCSCTVSANNQVLHVRLQQTAPGCGISASNLSFGNYTGAVNNAQTTLQVGCSNGTPYTVGLDQGTTPGGSASNPRLMAGPSGATLAYGLYQNAARTTNWGNSSGSWESGTGTGTIPPQTLTVYGRIPAGTVPATGSYTDTITATITY
jgi:spore coat protein U-like protein